MNLIRRTTHHAISRLAAALLVAGGLLGGLAAVPAAPARAAGDCTVPATEIGLDTGEQSLLSSINTFRQQNGRAALGADATLNKAAMWASRDDVKLGQAPANHIDSLGRNIEPRLRDCLYTTYSYIAENNFWGSGSSEFTGPGAAMNFWTNSPGHRANLLDARVKFIGIGRVCDGNRCFYTLDFGSDAGPAATGTVPPPAPPPAQPPVPPPAPGTGMGTGAGTGTAMSRPVLELGSQGAAVLELQRMLREHGYPVEVDGDFGPQTEGAVIAFQMAKGLVVDGIVGPQTWGALMNAAMTGAGTAPTGAGPTMSRPELSFGSQGAAVRELQTQLGRHGYAVTVDGDFGQQTAAAVRAFQTAKMLVVDGIVGPQTWGALLQPPAPGLRAPERPGV